MNSRGLFVWTPVRLKRNGGPERPLDLASRDAGISLRANMLKRDGTLEEFKRLVTWMNKNNR